MMIKDYQTPVLEMVMLSGHEDILTSSGTLEWGEFSKDNELTQEFGKIS